MRQIIINADDFGLSKGINKGIIKAYKEGILTSASLMVNMPGFEDAVALIRENPGLDIGLHLNFFRGMPVLSLQKTATLVGKDGFFIQDIFRIVKNIYEKKISFLELETECEAQINKALEKGIRITHIDSEKHLHLIGPVYEIVVRLAKKYGINTIRNINEYPYVLKFILRGRHIFSLTLGKVILLQILSQCKKKINSINSIKTADYSFGLLGRGGMTLNKCERLFEYSKEGTTEIFCHLGYIDEEWQFAPLNEQKYYINTIRERELEVLLSPRLKEAIHNLNIELVNFSKL
jgi:hopanoid biosynthesis associated protein HpnK